MKVLVHPDPFVLESELLDRVAASKTEDALAPVLVIVPTARLAAHARRRIAERQGACLVVEVLHHRALARTILEGLAAPPPRVLTRPLLEALLKGALAGSPGDPLARFAKERPGAIGAILDSIRDLRDAGVAPAEFRSAARGSREEALAALFERYVAALAHLRSSGVVDDADLAREAAASAERFAARYRTIVHHGAYEIIGVHLELIRALDRGREVAFLSPIEPGARVSAYAANFAQRHLVDGGGPIERLADRPGGLLGPRLASLFDEDAPIAEPLPSDRVRFQNAQGAVAEVETAVRHALDAVTKGTSPAAIALIARSLDPYAGAIDEAIGEQRFPYTSSASAPLRRAPEIRDVLLLLRAAADAFPRARTVEVLASPRVRWESLGLAARPGGDLADAWSRRAGIVGGLDEWTSGLVEWAERSAAREVEGSDDRSEADDRVRRRVEEARSIGDAVSALATLCVPGAPRSWRAHAGAVERIALEIVRPLDAGHSHGPEEAFLAVLSEMRALETLLGDARDVPFAEMIAWLEGAVDDVALSPRAFDDGGFRVLDATQARGLTFDRVFLVGMNSGAFPRVPREDPFLSDATRERLREATGRPVPVRTDAADEERLLLALVLGSARERFDVSWQRADDEGKSRTASIALREVARVAIGKPSVDAAREAARKIPAHPARRLEALVEDLAILSPTEETLLIALRGDGGEDAARILGERDGGSLADGMRMLLATESFEPATSPYDGRVGAGKVRLAHAAVTALERLGRCPLQFFFRHALHVYELEEPSSAFEIARWDLGERVHALLDSVYRTLRGEGLFGAGCEAEATRRARALLREAWEKQFAGGGSRLTETLPVLWDIERERWLAAIDAFLGEDLARLAGHGWIPESFEEKRARPVDLGDGVTVEIEGRMDRISRRGAIGRVGDYKTGEDLEERADESMMLKGIRLQVPLYAMIAGADASVELLGVGPNYVGITAGTRTVSHAAFEGFSRPEVEAGVLETLRVLVRLARDGAFALRKDRHCGYCSYVGACRRNHPPTAHRETFAPESRDYRDLARKTKKKQPTLADVRAAGAAP